MNRERLAHGLRTALGCLLGVLLAWLLQLPGQWLVVSVAIVLCTEPRFGGLLRRSSQRLWGTVLGALVAVGILALFREHQNVGLLVAFPVIVAFGYLAADPARSYLGALGAVTTVLVLLEPSKNLEFAGRRLVSVVLGLGVALLVARSFPNRAVDRLKRSLAEVLQELAEVARTGKLRVPELETRFIQELMLQKKLIEEVSSEEGAGPGRWEAILTAERHAYRHLMILCEAPCPAGFLPALADGLEGVAARWRGHPARVEWPRQPDCADPLARVCLQHLLAACNELDRGSAPEPAGQEEHHG